jgi:guanylate kinase
MQRGATLSEEFVPQWYPLLIIISGPAGAGKDSLVRRMKELGYPFHFVVTATDRPPRPGEVHGVDYFFIPEQIALRLSKAREEMAQIDMFDYVVVNREGELDRAVHQVVAIIEAEHCRVHPRIVRL